MKSPTHHSSKLPAGLARVLDRTRHRHLTLALAEFPVYLLAGIALAGVLQASIDRVFDLPWSVRCVLLALDGIGVLGLAYQFVLRPWQKRLDRKGAALLIERRIPEFRSSLISAVELSDPSGEPRPNSRPLVERLLCDVAAMVETPNVLAHVLPTNRFKKLSMRMSLPVIGALALLLACQPVSGLLLKRILLSRQNLPTATTVVSVTRNLRVDEGGDAILTASAKGLVPPGGKLVITRSGLQPETISVPASTPGGAQFSQVVRNIRAPFTYHFELNDGTGPDHELSLHYPPAVNELRLTQIYPAYTGLSETVMSPTALKLLEGSTLRIEGTASQKLAGGVIRINGAAAPVRLILTDPDKFHANLTVPGTGWKSFSVHLEGTQHDGSIHDAEYPLQLERDKPPLVNLAAPKEESVSVLMNSTLPVSFEVADDYGISSVSLNYQVFRPLSDGSLEQAEGGSIPFPIQAKTLTWKRTFSWNLSRLLPAVPTGGNIVFWMEVADNNGTAGPLTSRSSEKTVRIVSQEQKRLELLERLGEKAAEMERLYEQQQLINARTESAIK